MARQREDLLGVEHPARAAKDFPALAIIKPCRARGHHEQHPIGDRQADRLGYLRGARFDARSAVAGLRLSR
jgi:hypothetical protein